MKPDRNANIAIIFDSIKSICHFAQNFLLHVKMADPKPDSDFYFNLDSARKFQFHQSINSLLCRLVDVKKTAV